MMTTQPSVDTDLARHVRHLIGEDRQRVRHVVDRLAKRGDLTFGLHGEPLTEIAVCHGRHDLHDASDLVS